MSNAGDHLVDSREPPRDGASDAPLLLSHGCLPFPLSLNDLDPKTALIVGAGYVGLERAEALPRRGIHTVTQSRRSLSKIKALVPEFVCSTPFATGVRDTVNWYDANPDQQIVDPNLDATFDHLIAATHPPGRRPARGRGRRSRTSGTGWVGAWSAEQIHSWQSVRSQSVSRTLWEHGGGWEVRRCALQGQGVDVVECRLDTGDEFTRVFRGHGFGGVDPVDDLDPQEPVVIGDLDAASGAVSRASVAAAVLGATTGRIGVSGHLDVVVVGTPGLVSSGRHGISVRPDG